MMRMRERSLRSLSAVLLVALAIVGIDHRGVAAQGKPAAVAAAPGAAKDERALKLLKSMSDTLAQARTLSFRARSLVPMAGPNGQWISLLATSRVVMQRPDKFFVEMRGDVRSNDLYYNGRTWTAIAPNEKFYSQRELAGQTIDAMIEEAYEKQDDLFPFADVLWSDAYGHLSKDLLTTRYVGQSTVGGVQADHLALTAQGLDWEIWIGARDRLPRLMIGAYRDLERQPTFTVEFADWRLNPPVTAKTFSPAIPAGATRIEFKRAGAAPVMK